MWLCMCDGSLPYNLTFPVAFLPKATHASGGSAVTTLYVQTPEAGLPFWQLATPSGGPGAAGVPGMKAITTPHLGTVPGGAVGAAQTTAFASLAVCRVAQGAATAVSPSVAAPAQASGLSYGGQMEVAAAASPGVSRGAAAGHDGESSGLGMGRSVMAAEARSGPSVVKAAGATSGSLAAKMVDSGSSVEEAAPPKTAVMGEAEGVSSPEQPQPGASTATSPSTTGRGRVSRPGCVVEGVITVESPREEIKDSGDGSNQACALSWCPPSCPNVGALSPCCAACLLQLTMPSAEEMRLLSAMLAGGKRKAGSAVARARWGCGHLQLFESLRQ